MKRLIVLACTFAVAGWAQHGAARRTLTEWSQALEDLAAHAAPSVVEITTHGFAPLESVGVAGVVTRASGTGSGVVVEPDGVILTNAHVVASAHHVDVLVAGKKYEARVLGVDKTTDLAVLKIDAQGLPALKLGDSDKLRQGQIVIALGSPLGLRNSVTAGIVSSPSRQLTPEDAMVYIQTDAAINPGNSGGPLLTADGDVVGINTLILSQGGGNEGLGFAIPSNLAKYVYERLKRDGRVRRGTIGAAAQTITPDLAVGLGLTRTSGVILADVRPDSGAEAAGLRPGDVLLSVDGRPIESVRDYLLAVHQRSRGDEIQVEVLRRTETLKTKVTVLERPNEVEDLADLVNTEANLVRPLGVLATGLDARTTAILPGLREAVGVVVAAIPAEYAGLNPGLLPGDVIYSVNRMPVTSVDDLRKTVEAYKPHDSLALQIERHGRLLYLAFELD